MYDLATDIPTEHAIEHALVSVKGWYEQCTQEKIWTTREIRLPLEGTTQLRPWWRVPFLLEKLERAHGVPALDRWWQEEGRQICWDTERGRPLPVVTHLLSQASECSNSALCLWALDQGWSPDSVDANMAGKTPLHHWVRATLPRTEEDTLNYHSVLDRLLTAQNVNMSTKHGQTALSLLIARDVPWHTDSTLMLKLCQKLCNAGAQIHVTDSEGWTPLHYAVAGTHTPNLHIISWLLTQGAHPTFSDLNGETPLSLCQTAGMRWSQDIKRMIVDLLTLAECQREAAALKTVLAEPSHTSSPKRVRL